MFGLVRFVVLTSMFAMNNKDYPGSTLLRYSLPNQGDLFPQTNKNGTTKTAHFSGRDFHDAVDCGFTVI